MPNLLAQILAFSSFIYAANADNSTNSTGLDNDPYLQYRPPFVRSLPVQILLTGVVFTLVAVLFIHLIFTGQYHWPLAPVNYVLQISGVTTLLISLIATLHVVLSASMAESQTWPYMLSYIAVNVPPLDTTDKWGVWSSVERATWLVMNATTSGLIQITHIQFLTLLYPSRLEGRLIFFLLAPLAIVAAVMQLIPIHGSTQVNTIASAIRNVCNATLSLLFTASLFIWGLLVNRRQAWRTDGGTAAFGAAALTLALVSTGLNFLYVPREEEYVWLPGLMWAVVLWQSFLGWWWWVGAGSGSGVSVWDGKDGMEEMLKKEEKRERRRRDRGLRRKETRERAKVVWRGVAGAFAKTPAQDGTDRANQPTSSRSHSPSPPASPTSTTPPSPIVSAAPFSVSTYSLSSAQTYTTLPRLLPDVVHRWYASLRQAHLTATRQQAAERVERIRELERSGAGREDPGWGLGSFAWRLGRERGHNDESAGEFELYDRPERQRRRRERRNEGHQPERRARDRNQSAAENVAEREEVGRSEDVVPSPAATANNTDTRPQSMWWWGPLGRWRLQDSTIY